MPVMIAIATVVPVILVSGGGGDRDANRKGTRRDGGERPRLEGLFM